MIDTQERLTKALADRDAQRKVCSELSRKLAKVTSEGEQEIAELKESNDLAVRRLDARSRELRRCESLLEDRMEELSEIKNCFHCGSSNQITCQSCVGGR